MRAVCPVCVLVALVSPAFADPPEKRAYIFFSPTPREQMRPMSTDRPDATESPFTVDTGHLQFEMSFVDFSRDDGPPRMDALTVAPFLLKVGLTHKVDVQFGLDPYVFQWQDGASAPGGVGDFTVRLKINVFGNDSGNVALAIMPYVKTPTGDADVSNGVFEGGLIVPAAFDLGDGWSMGAMLQLDARHNDDMTGDGFTPWLVHTITVGHDIVGDLAGFVEFAGAAPLRHGHRYEAGFNTGLTYALTPDIQLDAGIRVGLTAATEDFGAFAGISLRY